VQHRGWAGRGGRATSRVGERAGGAQGAGQPPEGLGVGAAGGGGEVGLGEEGVECGL